MVRCGRYDIESCTTQVAVAYQAALAMQNHRVTGGSGIGVQHEAVQAHRPFSNVPMLKKWFESRSAIGGGSNTVDVARGSWRDDRLHETSHAASYRAIYDLSDLENSKYVIPTGQSGNLFSSHYQDMVALWSNGQYIEIPTDTGQLEGTHLLRLMPE